MKLSDLAGPDADGWSDVAVFVLADGSESEPFVVTESNYAVTYRVWIRGIYDAKHYAKYGNEHTVRRLGRGRLVPARIEMQGEAVTDLAAQVRTLRAALEPFAELDRSIGDEWQPVCGTARAALATTAPTPTEERQ